jgi:hypothetical protein
MNEDTTVGRDAAPRFCAGDKVQWRDDPRVGVVSVIAEPDAVVTYTVPAYAGGPPNDAVPVCCELRNLVLVARAVYLDAEDVQALTRVLGGAYYDSDRDRVQAIIARAKRDRTVTETMRTHGFEPVSPERGQERIDDAVR